MKINNVISAQRRALFLLVPLIALGAFGFQKTSEYKEYLTLTVTYEWEGQILTISQPGKVEKIAFIRPGLKKWRKSEFALPGVKIEETPLVDIFDNRHVLEKIAELEEKGWKMKSHDFSMGMSASVSSTDSRREQTKRVSFYLFE